MLALRSRKVYVLQWIKRSVARQAGVIVAGALSTAALFIWFLGKSAVLPALPVRVFMVGLACIVPAATLFAAWVTERLVGSRLAHLAEVIDGAGPHDDLARIRDLGADEVGAIGHAVNRLLARITSIRASMIDQKRELGEAHRELELKKRLAAKTDELAQRLEERALLFEIMRMTTSSPELHQVLATLVDRVGQMLRMREVVFFLYEEALEAFGVQATWGFARKDALDGRTLKLGEGISGAAGQQRAPIVIEDLSREDGYLGFWGEAERTGSLAAVPIVYREKLLGVLTVTRAEHDPITDVHVKLLCAIADNAALALRNAQLFARMRELSTHDEQTGLANQRLMRDHLEREIDRARRFDKSFSLMSIDLDNFRQVTDAHRADMVLRDMASLLVTNLRKVDTIARVGHDAFMVLLPRSELRDALQVAEKLRRLVHAHPFFDASEQDHPRITASIGVAQLASGDDARGESLRQRAEQALATARKEGKNRVCSEGGDGSSAVEPARSL